MQKHTVRQSLLLFLAAFIWGVAFVAQSNAMEYVQPFTFMSVRNIIGGLFLIPCIMFLKKIGAIEESEVTKSEMTEVDKLPAWMKKMGIDKNLLTGGIVCGVILCVAGNLQQFGILYTSVGKSGFLTAIYIILVPVFGIFLKRKAGIKVWISVLIALAGLYLLCVTEKLTIVPADFMLLGCAAVFSFHILAVDHFVQKCDGVKLSCIQFLVCGILSGVCMFLFEQPNMNAILAAWLPIAYAGFLSSGVAYTLQVVGQKGTNPTVASLILSLESVFSALAGWVLLHQILSTKEMVGCGLVFLAIVLAQLPVGKKEMKNE